MRYTENTGADFNIFYVNIRSLKNKLDLLEDFLVQSDIVYDCVCVTEHWFTAEESDGIVLPGYWMAASFDRVGDSHGGCMIFLRCGVRGAPRGDIMGLQLSWMERLRLLNSQVWI